MPRGKGGKGRDGAVQGFGVTPSHRGVPSSGFLQAVFHCFLLGVITDVPPSCPQAVASWRKHPVVASVPSPPAAGSLLRVLQAHVSC